MISNLGLGICGGRHTGRLALGHRLGGLGEALEVELVGVPFAVHLLHDILVVIVPESSAELIIVHVGLALSFAPLSGHLVGIQQLEFAIATLPRDAARVGLIRQQFEKELPQLDLSRATVDRGQMVVSVDMMGMMMMVVVVRVCGGSSGGGRRKLGRCWTMLMVVTVVTTVMCRANGRVIVAEVSLVPVLVVVVVVVAQSAIA